VSGPEHQARLDAALAREGEAHRAALAGDWGTARRAFASAEAEYRASWEAAGPGAYGRLVGMVKTAVLAGGGSGAAAYARGALEGADAGSPAAAYALALAALVQGDDATAEAAARRMRTGSDAFARTADALAALATGDEDVYASALQAIVDDFAARDAHLTGVPVADTAMVLEELAAARALRQGLRSPLLPTDRLTR
jgi:hypothetical protein